MSKYLFLQRCFASSQYRKTGFRYCTQAKAKPHLLIRNKDKRVRQLEDLTKTIDQLQNNKAALELESSVKFRSRKNIEYSVQLSSENRNQNDGVKENIVEDSDAKWNASLQSFSSQLAGLLAPAREPRNTKDDRSETLGRSQNKNCVIKSNLSANSNSNMGKDASKNRHTDFSRQRSDVESLGSSSNILTYNKSGKKFLKNKTVNSSRIKPHVEHQEQGTSHFSKMSDVHVGMEILSTYELLVLSQASSLPAKMRQTFQNYLNTRQSVTSSTSSLALPPSVVSIDVQLLNSSPAELLSSVPDHSELVSLITKSTEPIFLPLNPSESISLISEHGELLSSALDHVVPSKEFFEEDVEQSDLAFVSERHTKNEIEPIRTDAPTIKPKRVGTKSELVWSESDIDNPETVKDLITKVAALLKESRKSEVVRAIGLEQQAKDAVYIEELSTFVDLCIMTNMLKYAQYVLTMGYLHGMQAHKGRPQRTQTRAVRPVRDLPTYNKLMHAWAKQGNMEPIHKLLSQLKDLEIKPNLQSYAAVLECIGRQEPVSRGAALSCINKIEQASLKLENIFCESRLVGEDEKYILKAIRSVNLTFSPNRTDVPVDYTNPLLSHLNTKTEAENPWHGVVTAEELSRRAVKQLQFETLDQVIVDSILAPPQMTPEILAAKERLSQQREKWREGLKRGFLSCRRHLQAYIDVDVGPSLVPYLRLWNSDAYVDLMLQEVEVLGQDMALYSPTCSVLYHILGNKIYDKFVVQSRLHSKYTDKMLSVYKKYAEDFDAEHLCQNHRELWTNKMKEMEMETFLFSSPKRWPSTVTKALGKFLYDIIMSQVKVTANFKSASSEASIDESNSSKIHLKQDAEIPAFFTVYRMREAVLVEEVLPHPFLVRLYEEANVTHLSFRPRELPSLVPPIPWVTHDVGGNLLSTTHLTRSHWLTNKQMDMVNSRPVQELYPMYDGLNAVGACPWIINKPMLDLVIGVFNEGGNNKLDIPENIKLAGPLPKITSDMSIEHRLKVLKENKELLKDRKEAYSQWCTELYRLSIANKYRDEIFWFPHNIDFRGRTYPTPPHFNHIGGDVGRCLLMFGKGKPLGEHGLDWLKTHLVNLTGFKKRQSNVERLEFANDVMDEVLDSADKPFTGRGWWQTSDEPWQTLACCKEIASAVRSPVPQEYVSHLPVHQDGSFNGMQHYAALGRDNIGAQSVNLEPFSTPQDVYSNVVELVEKQRVKEAADGVEIAKSLEGFVRRKIIKQTIMTTVYGVTKYGARTQIRGQLRHVPTFSPELIFPSMSYLADKTFHSLHQMFGSMKEIQDWFVLCADIVSRVRQKPMEWETPLGWPIIQPYFKSSRISDKKLGGAFIERPNSLKQKNAFPPNFIHSLDSAHMILTAIHCLRAGICFVSVHDCFWTHACDVDTMNKVCREQFVSLHSQPILEDLSRLFEAKFAYDLDALSGTTNEEKRRAMEFVNYVLRRIPQQGTFDINKVLESTYFFS